MNLRHALTVVAFAAGMLGIAANGYAACTGPAGQSGDIKYASNYGVMAFCNGTNWVSMAGGVSVTVGGTTGATTLHALTDVDDSAKATGTYLKYDGTDWVATNPFGTLNNGGWCTSDGTSISCASAAPVLAEVDPQVGTITSAGNWCTTDGSAINCATASPLGTMTDTKWCVANGSGQVVCTTDAPVLTEVDPKVGSLSNGKWCTTDGSTITCTTDAPILTEADPQVDTLNASNFCQVNGGGTAITCTNDAAAQRTALGLGTMATQNADAVAITGGTATLTGLTAANVTATTALSTASLCDENGANCKTVSSLTAGGDSSARGDRISSTDNQSMVIANGGTGTVSFTLGGTAQSAYFYPGLGLVTQGISTTTNQASFTTVYASGNVGIGTDAPLAKFVVSLNEAALPAGPTGTQMQIGGADDASTRMLLDTFGTGAGNFTMRRARGTAAAPSAVLSEDVLGQISFFGYGASAYGSYAQAAIRSVAEGDWTNTSQPGGLVFFTGLNGTAAGSMERLRITNAGYVGVGTPSPTATLQVSGSFVVSTTAQTTTPTLYANTSGNVGIGTSAPSQMLHLKSSVIYQPQILLENTTDDVSGPYWNTQKSRDGGPVVAGDSLGTFVFRGADSASAQQNAAFFGGRVEALGTGYVDGAITFSTAKTGTTAERMRITAAGNVGIGTTTPGSRLHVSDTTYTRLTLGYGQSDQWSENVYQDNAGNNKWGMGVFGDTHVFSNAFYLYQYKDAADATVNKYRMYVNDSGLMGIGTTVPTHALQVSSTSVSQAGLLVTGGTLTPVNTAGRSSSGQIMVGTDSYFGSMMYDYQTGDLFIDNSFASASGDIIFRTQTSSTIVSAVTITGDGKVGIGTTSPETALEVNGQITGGFGTVSTVGTLDWNDASNARAGSGYTLLTRNATNGPGGSGVYYHPFSFEYATKDGSGNLTQFAIPYGYSTAIANSMPMYIRGRYSGTWTSWFQFAMATVSDYRLKKNVKTITSGGLDTVMKMRPVRFSYVDEKGSKSTREGFIAHEMQEIAPYAVTGKKDEVDASGKPLYQNMNYGEITPLLTAAIQELKGANDNLVRELKAANDNNARLEERIDRLERAIAGQ